MERQDIVSVFRKPYLLFIALIVVIYGCIILIFATYAVNQRQEENENARAAVKRSADNLSEQLGIVAELERSLVSDSRMTAIRQNDFPNEYERSVQILELLRNIKSFRSMNRIIEDISLLFPRQKLALSAQDDLVRTECIPGIRTEGDTARSLLWAGGQMHMELWYPLTRSTEEDYQPDFGVRVTLSREYLEELLEPFKEEQRSGAFCMLQTGTGLQLLFQEDTEGGLAEIWQHGWEEAGETRSYQGRGRFKGQRYLFLSEQLPEYGVILVTYRNGGWMGRPMVRAVLLMGCILILFGAMFLLVLRQTDLTVNKPLQQIVQAFEKVQNGDLTVRISHQRQDEFRYIYSAFNRMAERISQLIENVKEQGRLLQNAELMQLQSQINPHFLYNSFYLIRIMAKNESYEQINRFSTSLAKYYRFLNKEVEQNIPLEKEVEHMRNYIDIQQMRFGDKITVYLGEIPEETAEFRVPKLILQPIVENAYNYGVKNLLQDGRITVIFEKKEGFLFICIEDNGEGGNEANLVRMREAIRDYQGSAAGHALPNIDRRLHLAFGDDSGLSVECGQWGGLRVVMKMNLSVCL